MAGAAERTLPSEVEPTLDEVRELAREHNVIPLRHSYIDDVETPVSAFLKLRGLRVDCDGDALLALVEPAGPACHTGERTCFFSGDLEPGAPHEVLPKLERTIAQRAATADTGASYTARLLADPPFIGQKVEEEAEEVARAAREETDERVASEAADVLYHLTVLLHSRDRMLEHAQEVLNGRRR